jgi:ribosomal protein L30E
MNIWEIVNLNDLVKILKENEKKFVIVAVTLDSTPKPIVKSLKKFLKHYSKIYKNLTFLYYNADKKDLGRVSFLTKNVDEYPFVYHIYDTSEIFVSVNRANGESIYEAFTAVEEYYKKDLENFLISSNKDNKENTENTENTDKSSNIKINNKLNDIENINNVSNEKIKQDEITADMNRKALQHQKLLEKIALLEKEKEKYNVEFLQDIKQRKKDETKQRKENL